MTKISAAMLGFMTIGCGQPVLDACPRATGVFHGQYSYVSGTCEPTLQGRALLLKKDDAQNTTSTVNSLSDSVTTEITLIGCTIAMRQDISAQMGLRKISSLVGDLNVASADALSGQISRTEYMADGTTVRCTGSYNATYTRDSAPIGSAADHALSAP